jgi:capsular polysaccharide export protein
VKIDTIPHQLVYENPALTVLKASRSVLLLQGPVGPFFDRLTDWLLRRKIQVHRIVFSGGDEYDCKAIKPIKFASKLEEWREFFTTQCVQLKVDVVILFGQSRAYHQDAIQVAAELNLEVVVLEEGYFRPGYLTVELKGVNGNSTTLDRFKWAGPKEHIQSATDNHPFLTATYFAAIHYAQMLFGHFRYKGYQHHRHRSVAYYFTYWMYSWFRKLIHRNFDLRRQEKLLNGKEFFYFVPLQFEGDAQLKLFSNYKSVEDFLYQIIRSFSIYSPQASLLVFREHPHGRGMGGYKKFIHKIALRFNIDERIIYLVEGDTPLLVKHSAGVVTVNSTVGLRALDCHVPLKVMGSAVYMRPGLVFDGELDEFWSEAVPAKQEIANEFILQLKNLTQLPICGYAPRNIRINWQ